VIATHFASSSDLPPWAVFVAALLSLMSSAILLRELRHRERGGVAIVATGIVAVIGLLFAILRPVRIASRESLVGARIVVLADASRSMALAEGGQTREDVRDQAIRGLERAAKGARLSLFAFGDGAPRPLDLGAGLSSANHPIASAARTTGDRRSDLAAAIRAIGASPDERPRAIVVLSDGRLDDPPEGSSTAALESLGRSLDVPIHTVATSREPPADASIRHVVAAGAAVAHVPLPLRIEVGCAGALACDELTVTAKELRDDGPPALLASGLAHLKGGKGTLDLTVTLDRAGARILEVAVTAPPGDTIPENDRRFVTFDVARERVRVLHVAGEPTNDVRALREWLKSDASIDVVAFFILRTHSDDPHAPQEDLALIPFPVDELFSVHLPSFDAVVLQDFDAQPYGLEQHLPELARYVRGGGGLIMVGGDNAFVKGGYANTPLGDRSGVLPVLLDGTPEATPADLAPFTPSWTEAGRAGPLLAPLRAIVGEELPVMPGANVLGDVRQGSTVLWQHPVRTTPSGAPMPVLAIGEQGDGRTIALGIDGGWELAFSQLGARTAGRGHGALWNGLLGWLMRDPRFEPAQLDVVGGCTAEMPSILRAHLLPIPAGSKPETLSLDITRIDRGSLGGAAGPAGRFSPIHIEVPRSPGDATELLLPPLASGGYTARLRTLGASSTRYDFACEAGGDEWADSRPDPARLKALSDATGGTFLWADDDMGRISLPAPTRVSSERHVVPVAPPWAWSLFAAVALGAHWIARRRSGLS
jgi:uncharacterized membrane protein